jgi:ribosomal protein S18 acetylase RimI-like enzyme
MNENISLATIADIPSLLKLINSAYRGASARKGWTHESDLVSGDIRTNPESLKEMIQNPNAVILKYTLNGEIVGSVYLEKQDHKMYLGMLAVSPDIQAQGIGKKLMSAAEEHAEKMNCTTIHMTVITVRNKLIAWYERKGYHKTGDTKPFPNDGRFGMPLQPIEFIVMEKQLGHSNS